MRKFEINKNTTGEVSRSQIPNTQQQGQLQQDARSETWSVDVYASDGEGVQAQDSLEQRTVEGRSVVNGNEVANQEALRLFCFLFFLINLKLYAQTNVLFKTKLKIVKIEYFT